MNFAVRFATCLLLALGLSVPAVFGAAPQDDAQENEIVIELEAVAGLQFDAVRFAVPPGAQVTLRLENVDDMSHNLLITEPGSREAVVEASLQTGASAQDYIPDLPEVLWTLPTLEPGASASITFTAPEEEGVYPYVCTLPGHGSVMYGAMYVTNEDLPPLAEDPNIPPRQAEASETTMRHPYPDGPPTVSRTFMPEASPAAIAVWLTDDLSYSWDAGRSMLRYAWRGGFVDNTAHWQGKGQETAHVVGTIFYRNHAGFPLRIGSPEHVPQVRFLGYRLREGIPTYHYRIDGRDVFERITARPEGDGLIRTFEIDGLEESLWFVTGPSDGVTYRSSAGTWSDGMLQLAPAQARTFTLTMIDQEPDLP